MNDYNFRNILIYYLHFRMKYFVTIWIVVSCATVGNHNWSGCYYVSIYRRIGSILCSE